jgi:hypothetical protein
MLVLTHVNFVLKCELLDCSDDGKDSVSQDVRRYCKLRETAALVKF